MSMDRRRKAAQRTLTRRHGMLPAQAEELSRRIEGLDDWRVRCQGCDTTIVGTPAMIRQHAEECHGP